MNVSSLASAPRSRLFSSRVRYLYDLLIVLVGRDMKLLYKRSMLGVLWTLINPLLQLSVFLFLFQSVVKVNIPNYPSYVFTGLLTWQWFQVTLVQAAGVIVSSRALIRQPGFPVTILPPVVVTTGWLHLLLAMPVLAGFLVLDGVSFSITVLWLPVIQAIQFLLLTSLSYIFAGLNVSFRDTTHTLRVLLQILFYMTPVFYDAEAVPEEYRWFYGLNPMVHIVDAYRRILVEGQPPDWYPLGVVGLCGLILLPIGYRLFVRQSHRFVEEL